MPMLRVKLYYYSWPAPVGLAVAAADLAGSTFAVKSDFSTPA
jgi:hypothetical protein